MYISVLNGVSWEMWQLDCGICQIGLLGWTDPETEWYVATSGSRAQPEAIGAEGGHQTPDVGSRHVNAHEQEGQG